MDADVWRAKLAGRAFVYNICDSRHAFDFMAPFYNEKFTAIVLSFDDGAWSNQRNVLLIDSFLYSLMILACERHTL